MYEYLTQLHHKLIFTKADVTGITGSSSKASALLLNYQSKGLVVKVRRDLYCVTNLASQAPEASKMQIASAISHTSAVAYHSALEYHGFAHQAFFQMTVISDTRFQPFEFDGILYTYFRDPIADGIISPKYDSKVRVTDLERTVLDCIDRIDISGGTEELLNSLSSIRLINADKLLRYLKAYSKVALYKKAGFVLSLLNGDLHLPDGFFEICRSYSDRSSGVLTTSERCDRFISEWKLYVPQNITTFLNSTSNDDI